MYLIAFLIYSTAADNKISGFNDAIFFMQFVFKQQAKTEKVIYQTGNLKEVVHNKCRV